jgi:hypothetical protein
MEFPRCAWPESTAKAAVRIFIRDSKNGGYSISSACVGYARHELGEKFGREHYHWIIGAEEWKPTLADMFRLNALWDRQPKCGFSRNHQFDPRLNGVEYVTKCLSGSALRDSLGGDFYEGSKFALRGRGDA